MSYGVEVIDGWHWLLRRLELRLIELGGEGLLHLGIGCIFLRRLLDEGRLLLYCTEREVEISQAEALATCGGRKRLGADLTAALESKTSGKASQS